MSYKNKQVIVLIFMLTGGQITYAQQDTNFPPPESSPVVMARKTSSDIKIDGKLDEPDWQLAVTTSEFFRMEPRQGGEYLYNTYV